MDSLVKTMQRHISAQRTVGYCMIYYSLKSLVLWFCRNQDVPTDASKNSTCVIRKSVIEWTTTWGPFQSEGIIICQLL